ncbi:MAG: YhcN/YlaJ family sporulation lipoprotein [Clostridia bacterium]|nr:YhcN/YlaJ family sporulation lipoprotein [Clostridia bacterium]
MKKTLLTLGLMAGALLLTACTSGPDMTTVTSSPAPTTTAATTPDMTPQITNVMPQIESGIDSVIDGMTGQPTATVMPESTGVTSMDKARRVVESIEDELERLSEVDDAQVVIAGNKAAVALEFDDQYKGGVDDRLRGVVKERIASVISGVDTIAITTDEKLMDALETLGERLDTMSDMNALQSDLDAIIRKINDAQA